jgi:manganese transport protein
MLFAFSGLGLFDCSRLHGSGNWATDLAAGAQFYYTLLSVVIISRLMAIFLTN